MIDLKTLTPEQKEELKQQMIAEEKAEKEAAKKLKADYESLKNSQVNETFSMLRDVSGALYAAKGTVFDQFKALLSMKQELYGLSDEAMGLQQSHTFTSEDGKVSIIIGSNVIDDWSDDLPVGIGRVTAWIDKLAYDARTEQMVGIIKDLLKPNKDGILKANRILDLAKKADEIGDKELIDAVNFIRDQYKPRKTSTYVKAKYLDDNQVWQWLPLSMSAV
jgi:hypothetical protein